MERRFGRLWIGIGSETSPFSCHLLDFFFFEFLDALLSI
jgi:hypothetical protein